jgi:hypothetical protein
VAVGEAAATGPAEETRQRMLRKVCAHVTQAPLAAPAVGGRGPPLSDAQLWRREAARMHDLAIFDFGTPSAEAFSPSQWGQGLALPTRFPLMR